MQNSKSSQDIHFTVVDNKYIFEYFYTHGMISEIFTQNECDV